MTKWLILILTIIVAVGIPASPIFCGTGLRARVIEDLKNTGRDARSTITQRIEEEVQVEYVQLCISAFDSKGNSVEDLQSADFTVYDNGMRQTIVDFSSNSNRVELPLSLTILIDTSGSMTDDVTETTTKLDLAKEVALFLGNVMTPDDSLKVISFGEVSVDVTEARGVTNEAYIDAIRSIRNSFSGTALYASIHDVIFQTTEERARKILIICTDGADNVSRSAPEDVLKELSNAGITVMIFGTLDINRKEKNPIVSRYGRADEDNPYVKKHQQSLKILKSLAEITGGQFYFPDTYKRAQKDLAHLREAIVHQYCLGYEPVPKEIPGTHNLLVTIPSKKNLKLSYRRQYQ